jgi:hypothetical protein
VASTAEHGGWPRLGRRGSSSLTSGEEAARSPLASRSRWIRRRRQAAPADPARVGETWAEPDLGSARPGSSAGPSEREATGFAGPRPFSHGPGRPPLHTSRHKGRSAGLSLCRLWRRLGSLTHCAREGRPSRLDRPGWC